MHLAGGLQALSGVALLFEFLLEFSALSCHRFRLIHLEKKLWMKVEQYHFF